MKLIAYGSLLKKESLVKTLERNAELIPIVLPGYERVFDAPFGRYAFLNISLSGASKIESAYFELKNEELEKFARREAGSALIECMPGYFAFQWRKKTNERLPALQSYIDFCEVGATELGINFWKNTKKPLTIFNDRGKPMYP